MPKRREITCECETSSVCCTALLEEPIDQDVNEDFAAGFKALGDPYRVAIVHLLSAATGPICVVDIERHLPLAQSTVSYHLKFLADAGVISREKRGKWSYYSLLPERVDRLSEALHSYADLTAAGV